MTKIAQTLLLAGALAIVGCDKKPDAEPTETTGPQPAPAEKIVEAEIPDDLAAEAQQEITADNADQVAADLEKEIEDDL